MHHRESEHQPAQEQTPSRIKYIQIPFNWLTVNGKELREDELTVHQLHPLSKPRRHQQIASIYLKIKKKVVTKNQAAFSSNTRSLAPTRMSNERRGLTEPGKMRQPLRRIRHGPNQPIRRRLPHRVQQPKTNIKQHTRNVSLIPHPQLLGFRRYALPRIIPIRIGIDMRTLSEGKEPERNTLLVIPRPDVNAHNHTQQNRPSQERPHPPPILFLIEQQPNQHAPEDLRYPIHRVVQGPSLDVKQHRVVIAELPGVKVVTGKEHRKEEDDERVCSKRYPKASELGFPRWVSRSRHSRTVGSDHLVWCCHQQGDYHPHDRQYEERDLSEKTKKKSVPSMATTEGATRRFPTDQITYISPSCHWIFRRSNGENNQPWIQIDQQTVSRPYAMTGIANINHSRTRIPLQHHQKHSDNQIPMRFKVQTVPGTLTLES